MSKSQVDEAMLLSSLLSSGLYTQVPQGDEVMGGNRSARRRRKNTKAGEGEGDLQAAATKRRLSEAQVKLLETSFVRERKLESGRKVHLASELGLDPKQVAVWFQNRRARWKSKQLEEEYARLKSMHDAVVVEKCQLEAEVLKLKEQLEEAEKEIRKLSLHTGGPDVISCGERSSSPCSSFSMEAHQPLLGVGAGGDPIMCMHDFTNYANAMEYWANVYGM